MKHSGFRNKNVQIDGKKNMDTANFTMRSSLIQKARDSLNNKVRNNVLNLKYLNEQ